MYVQFYMVSEVTCFTLYVLFIPLMTFDTEVIARQYITSIFINEFYVVCGVLETYNWN